MSTDYTLYTDLAGDEYACYYRVYLGMQYDIWQPRATEWIQGMTWKDVYYLSSRRCTAMFMRLKGVRL